MKTCWHIAPALALLTLPVLACDLKVESAWIRVAPGNAAVLAGYAVLSNTGAQALRVVSAQSAAFERVEMHESLTENGIVRMRPIGELGIAAGGAQSFAPGGKHFMLMNPKTALRSGDVVAVKIKDAAGCEITASFKVGMAPGAAPMNSAGDHSTMDHSQHR